MTTMQELKELRERFKYYINEMQAFHLELKQIHGPDHTPYASRIEQLEEHKVVHQIIDERIKGDAILDDAICEIAHFPQSDGDCKKDAADAMRDIAIAASDAMKKYRYGLKNKEEL